MASASLISSVVLALEWIVFIIMLVGIYFAVNKNYSVHQKLLTTAAVVQLLFVLIMIFKFFSGTTYPSIVYVHLTGGSIVALLVLYTLLCMNEVLPSNFSVPEAKQKLLMRITAVFWAFFILSGTFVYILTYVAT